MTQWGVSKQQPTHLDGEQSRSKGGGEMRSAVALCATRSSNKTPAALTGRSDSILCLCARRWKALFKWGVLSCCSLIPLYTCACARACALVCVPGCKGRRIKTDGGVAGEKKTGWDKVCLFSKWIKGLFIFERNRERRQWRDELRSGGGPRWMRERKLDRSEWEIKPDTARDRKWKSAAMGRQRLH